MDVSAQSLIAAWAPAAAPPPDYTVSEWADSVRVLPQASGARGARWRTSAVPYLRGPMDAVLEVGAKSVAIMKASQIGGSEAIHNIIGYHIEHRPCPILMVHPTASVAEEWSKDRLGDMIRSTPALRSAVTDRRKRAEAGDTAESTLTLKMFAGGYLAIGSAKTPDSFARRSVRLAIGDDVDRWPLDVKGAGGESEGDPSELLINRTESFYNGVAVFVSTPTVRNGLIDRLFTNSDQRRYFVECPHCGRADFITWKDEAHFRIRWDEDKPETARIECPSAEFGGCGGEISEAERRDMIASGEFRPTVVPIVPGSIGFHIPAWLSTIGSRTLPTIVEKFLAATRKGREALRTVINTQFAEAWEERGTRADPTHVLATRKADYGDGVDVPKDGLILTAGVDVQDNRFECQVIAWGRGLERWAVDYFVVPGDPKRGETRAELERMLRRRYRHVCGADMPIVSTCVDTGFATEDIYDFVLANEARRVYATKGIGKRGGTPIVGKPSEITYGRNPRPVRLYPINVDDAKSDVIAAVTVAVPGPGYMHFPSRVESFDDEYFAQLCAEEKEVRYTKGSALTSTVWVLKRERNEALDTAVLALAAFKLLGKPTWDQWSQQLNEPGPDTPAPTAGGQTAPARARRFSLPSFQR